MALKRLGLWNLAAVLLLGGAIVGFTSKAALAQNLGANTGELTTGASDFRQYCAQCHGFKGIGNGPVASALKKKPANLTLLSKNNGGVFPEDEVRNFIDGSKIAEGHGTREMPIWGYAFANPNNGPGGVRRTPEEIKNKINLLVEYVKSIQEQ